MNSPPQNWQIFYFYHPSPFERDIIFKEFLLDSQSVEKEWSGIPCSTLAGFHQNSGFLNVLVTWLKWVQKQKMADSDGFFRGEILDLIFENDLEGKFR